MPRRRSSQRRILVLSSSVGQRSRPSAEALVRSLRAKWGSEAVVKHVDFLTECLPAAAVLARFAHQHSSSFFPGASGTLATVAESVDSPIVEEMATGGVEHMRAILESFEPAVVIAVAPIGAALACEAGAAAVVDVHTGLRAGGLWLHPKTVLHFVASQEMRDELVVAGVPWDRVVVTGIPVEAPAAGSKAAARKALGISDRFTAVVLPGQGSEVDTLELAGRLASQGIQCVVHTGLDPKVKRRVERGTAADGVAFVGGAERADEMLAAGDLLISTAGVAMLAEALAVGLPGIIVGEAPAAETADIDFLTSAGCVMTARDDADVLEKAVYLHTHGARLSQLAGNCLALGRPNASSAICERVSAIR